MVLDLNLNNASKVHFFIVSPWTRKDFQEQLLTAAQNGLPMAMAYNTMNEFSEKDTMGMLQLQEALGIPSVFKPLQTSYTTSNSGDVGRPKSDTGDLSPSGERSRNA